MPLVISIGIGVTMRNRSHAGVSFSRLEASAKKPKIVSMGAGSQVRATNRDTARSCGEQEKRSWGFISRDSAKLGIQDNESECEPSSGMYIMSGWGESAPKALRRF